MATFSSAATLLFAAIVATVISPTLCFTVGATPALTAWWPKSQRSKKGILKSTAAPANAITPAPPSWEDLSSLLSSSSEENQEEVKPVITLYRDTNGWCPFCERVWVCVTAKKLPYRERLINLQDKPEWFKELVPTALVPAVLFHDDEQQEASSKPERRLVWESLDIMQALDDAFPESPRLVLDTPQYKEAREKDSALFSAGLKFAYGGRNATLTAEDRLAQKKAFEVELDNLDESLASNGGPFRLGKEFTGVDAEIVPIMERWRYQLPITKGMNIMEGRPGLQKWFEAMDSFGPYIERVAGDEYSWSAVSSTFLRIFGGEETPELKASIEKADAAAAELTNNFVAAAERVSFPAAVAREAAAKLISNHEAVVLDCTRQEPRSQKHLPRASDVEAADAVLRYVAMLLVSSDGALATANNAPLLEVPSSKMFDASLAARTVAARLCAPRDMGAPAAKLLRGVLTVVADRLDKEASS